MSKYSSEEVHSFFDSIRQNNVDQVTNTLQRGADILLERDTRDRAGNARYSQFTALHHVSAAAQVAGCSFSKKMLEVLLQYSDKSLLELKDSFGRTPLHNAAHSGKFGMCESFISKATECGMNVQSLVNAKDDLQNTPLHEAARHGHRYVCAFLIFNNADVHAENKHKQTALKLAARPKDRKNVLLLIKSGANPKDLTETECLNFGLTNTVMRQPAPFMHLAAEFGNFALCDIALTITAKLQSEQDSDQTMRNGLHCTDGDNTALDLAVRMHNKGTITWILDQAERLQIPWESIAAEATTQEIIPRVQRRERARQLLDFLRECEQAASQKVDAQAV